MLRMMLVGAVALALSGGLRAETLAKVGGERIDSKEFEAKAAFEEANLKRKLTKDERLVLLRSLVNQRLLVAEAKRQKLDRKDDYKAYIAETERKALADQVYDAEISQKAQVSLEAAKEFYQQNPGAFDLAEVSQILIVPAKDKVAEGEKEAKELQAKLAKSPKNFAKEAKQRSDDPQSKARGGDLGTLRRGMLLPELEQAVFSAKPGSVVGPVPTQFGFHILHLRSLKRLSWDQAGTSLQQDLQRVKALQLQQALLDELAKKNSVKLYEDKL